MSYFKPKQDKPVHERKFFVPVDLDDLDDETDSLPPVSYAEEEAERRKDILRIVAGLLDFLGVVVGAVVVLMLLMVLISLLNWVYADMIQTFNLWQPRV